MPRRKNTSFGTVPSADLAYAVRQLIAMGKTTTVEVRRLAGERSNRIATLEAELAALRGGTVVAAPATGKAKATAKPKKKPVAVGKKLIRSDGRSFTRSAKVVAARRVQGQYLGYLRQVKGKTRDRFQAIAKDKGVPAAVVALKKHLGKGGTKAAPAKVAKAARPKAAKAKHPAARPKKKALPASYYRCAHPGCTKNWYVRGRPYCGQHAKLHPKTKK